MDSEELYTGLKELHRKLRNEQKEKWKRSVSFEDELFDRWEHARFLGFGEGTNLYGACLIIGDVKVGERTWIGPYTVLDGSGGGLSIGDNCSISSGVQIYTHDTVRKRISDGKIGPESAPTSIGASTYIGPLSIVKAGVTVGDHVIVGAHSFVNRDIPPYSIAVGTPCRIIGTIEMVSDTEIKFKYFEKEATRDEALVQTVEDLKKEILDLKEELRALKEARQHD